MSDTTEEQSERVFDLKENIWEAVHDLVDKMCEGEDPEVEWLVRLQLTEEFRFWKRMP